MGPPGNACAPPPMMGMTLRQSADEYPAIHPDQFKGTGHGKVALITGSSRGIGKAIASSFAESGYSVAITARDAGEVDETVKEIAAACPGVKVIGMPADGCKRSDLEMLVGKVNEHLGPIDALVCNAGTNTFMPFTMTDPDDWYAHVELDRPCITYFSSRWYSLEINLKSPTELTRIVLPYISSLRELE